MDIVLLVSQIVGVVVQTVSLIFLIIYVIKTAQMATATQKAAEASEKTLLEMTEARDQEIAPYVVCYFKLEGILINIVVKNIGKSMARNVKLEFIPPLQVNGASIGIMAPKNRTRKTGK